MDHGNHTTLLGLLANPLIFDHTCADLSVAGLLSLAGTSKAFRNLVYQSRSAFRFLSLSTAKGASADIEPIDRGGELWRNERIDEGVTEEDFYSGPLRGIFSFLRRKNVLSSVHTLVLDNQTAPAEVLHDVICSGDYQVQILSLIGAKSLNEIKLRKSLSYAVRPSRADDMPKLKGLYIFGASHFSVDPATSAGVTTSVGAQLGKSLQEREADAKDTNPWYGKPGRVIAQSKRLDDWAPTVHACEGIIHFDAVLCKGPKHFVPVPLSNSKDGEVEYKAYIDPAIASVSLPQGCRECHTVPEGPSSTKEAPSERLPLLSPPPRYTTSIKLAQMPDYRNHNIIARCSACLSHRCCEGCFKFWCEDCHDGEVRGRGDNSPEQGVKRDCWECGRLCLECTAKNEKTCKACTFAFCHKHNEGSTLSTCDWCQYSRRRGREMY